jgi:hypothetical protein
MTLTDYVTLRRYGYGEEFSKLWGWDGRFMNDKTVL